VRAITTIQLSEQQAVEAVCQVLGARVQSVEHIDAETPLAELGFDSLEAAELFIVLEEVAEQEIDPGSIENLKSVRDLVGLRPL